MSAFAGRRRRDTSLDEVPEDLQHGDYWRVLQPSTGEPMRSSEPSNLTGSVWMVYFDGGGVSALTKHTVREHDEWTASIVPNDGSSNSVAIGDVFHGYLERGVWRPV